MINEIRKKLVWKYTLIMLLMLMIVFIGNFFLINHIIMERRTSSLEKYLIEEVDEAIPVFLQYKVDKTLEPIRHFIDSDSEKDINNFVYWFDADNNLVMASGLSNRISEKKIDLMLNWEHSENELVDMDIIDYEGNKWNVVMTYQKAYHNGVFLGKVFVGKNITTLKVIQDKYISFVSALVIIMIILTFILADKMASRAMIPIIESIERQNKFVADASHEMRTPLSVMLASIDLLKTNGKNNTEIKDNIKNELLNMRELINELLDLARYDVKKTSLKMECFNLTNSTKEVIKNVQYLANNKNIKINFSSDNEIFVKADEPKIKRLMYIFIDNAIKYSPSDTIIDISLESGKNYITFEIKDEGTGIPEAEQEDIFKRFYRIDKARTRLAGGAGLGLSIAAEIINMHNGKIGVISNGKNGSVFYFNLKNSPIKS